MHRRVSVVAIAMLLVSALALAQDQQFALLAYLPLRAPSGEAVMHIASGEGAFHSVRFEAQGRAIAVDSARFDVQGGEPISVHVGQFVAPNHQGEPVTLPAAVVITRARIRYRLMGDHGHATLNLLAAR